MVVDDRMGLKTNFDFVEHRTGISNFIDLWAEQTFLLLGHILQRKR